MSKKYIVGVREVHVSYVTVTAENEEDAREETMNAYASGPEEMHPEEMYVEYSHTLDPDTWSVEEV